MKSLLPKLVVILAVMVLILCYGKVWGADWKEFAHATTGIFYYDAKSISSSSEGFMRLWIHNMTKHETNLIELNCKGGSYRVLDRIEYEKDLRIKGRYDYYDNPNWLNISSRSVLEPLRKIVCP